MRKHLPTSATIMGNGEPPDDPPPDGPEPMQDGGSVGSVGGTQSDAPGDNRWGNGPDGKPAKRRRRTMWSDLPRFLDNLTVKAMKQIDAVLSLPVTEETEAAKLRSIITADLGVMGHKIRVDEGAMRVKHDNDVLERLERLIRDAKRIVPKTEILSLERQKERKF